MKNLHLWILVSILALIGLSVFLYKVLVFQYPITPQREVNRWQIEAVVSFQGEFSEAIQLRLQLPHRTPGYMLVDESFLSRGYGQYIDRDEQGNRLAVWTIREGTPDSRLFYRGVVVPYQNEAELMRQPPTSEAAPKREWSEVEREAVRVIHEEALKRSVGTLSYVQGLLQVLRSEAGREAMGILELESGSNANDRIRLIAELLNDAGVVCRLTHGISLSIHASNVPMDAGLEFWDEKANYWQYLHGSTLELGRPSDLFVWYRGDLPRASLEGARSLRVNYSVAPYPFDALEAARLFENQRSWELGGISLFNLPMQQQLLFQVLLLVPFGALILAFFRNVVGWKTFGTFMPVLITLSFRETGVIWGSVLFIIVVASGLLVRIYFEHLKLLFVPRLSAVLSAVIIILLGLSLISHRIGFSHGLAISFFPIVILTMTIERISVVWEEMGPKEALQQWFGSYLLSVLLYPILFSAKVQHLFLVFPELILVILALTLLLGRYTGYRLTEFKRFSPMFSKKS